MYLKRSLIHSSVSSVFGEIRQVFKVALFTVAIHYATAMGLRDNKARKVYWALMTDPVIFGKDAVLTCVINDKSMPCSKESNRIWEGGPDGKLLLLNGLPSNHDKYTEETQNPCQNFSLVIRSITEFDVNCKYRCSVDFEDSLQNELTVKKTSFISMPNEKSTHNLTFNESTVDLNINLYQVYPFPKCKMVAGLSSVDVEVLSESRSDMFYDTTIHATQELIHLCSYCGQTVAVTVHCSLLEMSVFNLTENFNCSYKTFAEIPEDCVKGKQETVTTDSMHQMTKTILYTIVAILVVASVCLCIFLGVSRKRKLISRSSPDNDIEMRNSVLLDDHGCKDTT